MSAPTGNRASRTELICDLDYTFHCYARSEGLAAVIISKNYPQLTAHSILSKVLDEFLTEDRRTPDQKRNPKDNDATFAALKEYLQRYQDPAQASSITAIQQQLDETKIILHKTIDSVSYLAILSVLPCRTDSFYRSFSVARRLTTWWPRAPI